MRTEKINGKEFQLLFHGSKRKILVSEKTNDKLRKAEINILAKKKGYFSKTLEPNILTVFFVPSWKCNLDCVYCFEKKHFSLREHENCHIQWGEMLKKYLQSNKFVGINIVFFGGEPTLFLCECEAFYNSVLTFSGAVNVMSTIVTNAFEISEDFKLFCERCNVRDIQITIDPGEKYHNAFRRTSRNEGSYSNILGNTKKMFNWNLPITIRTNINNDNVDGLYDLSEELFQISKKNTVYWSIAPIVSTTETSQGVLKVENVCKVINDILRIVDKGNIQMVLWSCNCDFYGDSLLVLSPDGKIYNCVNFCKHGITKEDIKSKNNMEEKCKICFWSPLCGGGCKYQNYIHNDSFEISYCMRPVFESIVMPIIKNKIIKQLPFSEGNLKVFELEV